MATTPRKLYGSQCGRVGGGCDHFGGLIMLLAPRRESTGEPGRTRKEGCEGKLCGKQEVGKKEMGEGLRDVERTSDRKRRRSTHATRKETVERQKEGDSWARRMLHREGERRA